MVPLLAVVCGVLVPCTVPVVRSPAFIVASWVLGYRASKVVISRPLRFLFRLLTMSIPTGRTRS